MTCPALCLYSFTFSRPLASATTAAVGGLN
jgi:hypothetical protein